VPRQPATGAARGRGTSGKSDRDDQAAAVTGFGMNVAVVCAGDGPDDRQARPVLCEPAGRCAAYQLNGSKRAGMS